MQLDFQFEERYNSIPTEVIDVFCTVHTDRMIEFFAQHDVVAKVNIPFAISYQKYKSVREDMKGKNFSGTIGCKKV